MIRERDFLKAHQQWEYTGILRLGQYLLNKFMPGIADPEIFHCLDDNKAFDLFYARYVEDE